MNNLETLLSYTGTWQGTNRLWLSTTEPAYDSTATADVTALLEGKFVRLDYTWAVDGEAQAGSYLFGCETKHGLVSAAWIDSWHNGERMMICQGTVDEVGTLDLLGTYPAPSGPDWGWRTRIEPGGAHSFRLVMYNISPEGKEELAVEALFSHAA